MHPVPLLAPTIPDDNQLQPYESQTSYNTHPQFQIPLHTPYGLSSER